MSATRTSDFDYELPHRLIAQRPAPRGRSRLMVLRAGAGPEHRTIADLTSILRRDDLLVVNDTKVLPARLEARRELPDGQPGGVVELLLVEPAQRPNRWLAMARPGRRLRAGSSLRIVGNERDALSAQVVGNERDALSAQVVGRHGDLFELAFQQPVEPLLDRLGRMPLPPYVSRPDDDRDRLDYQTVFAREPGAVAAPTAGLHFTDALLAELAAAGIAHAPVTLHVGPGTFLPVRTEHLDQHRMHAERFRIPAATALAIARTRRRAGRVVAVGTTAVRALEAAALAEPGSEWRTTDLFIRPGFRFRVVDLLLTNFHLPESTLLMLVCAFGGRERVLDAYRNAVAAEYRFYSYGDAMLIAPEDRE